MIIASGVHGVTAAVFSAHASPVCRAMPASDRGLGCCRAARGLRVNWPRGRCPRAGAGGLQGLPHLQSSAKDGTSRRIFSLRSPARPYPIGTAIVQLVGVERAIIIVRGLDCLDGTPLLDVNS